MKIATLTLSTAGPSFKFEMLDSGWIGPDKELTEFLNRTFAVTSDYLQPYPGWGAILQAKEFFLNRNWVRQVEIVLSDEVKKLLARPQKIGVVN